MHLTATYALLAGDTDYLEESLQSVAPHVDSIVAAVSTCAWRGQDTTHEDLDATVSILLAHGARVCVRPWRDEIEHRMTLVQMARQDKATHMLIVDADEVHQPKTIPMLKKLVCDAPHVGQVRLGLWTYWRTRQWRIEPPEPLCAVVLSRLTPTTRYLDIRTTNEDKLLVCKDDRLRYHHYSYARSNEWIARKISSWSHSHQVIPDWYDRVWLGWTPDMTDLHPTHPACYCKAVSISDASIA